MPQPRPDRNDTGRLLFAAPCRFVAGAVDCDAMPSSDLPEVAFVGRSNVGKSSLINALTGRRALAKTSRTPGRTRQINFFSLDHRLFLVDLPGYGYASAPKRDALSWQELTKIYLYSRANLRRVCLLIDIRRGLKPSDQDMMALLNRAAQPYRIIFTKADTLKPPAIASACAAMITAIARHPAALPEPLALSARTGDSIDVLRQDLAALVTSGQSSDEKTASEI